MAININAIYESTMAHYTKAKNTLVKKEVRMAYDSAPISDVIPGFEADKLEFGSYEKANFAVLFVDMRNSTQRAEKVKPNKTFLTMHVFLPALLEVIKYHKGKVIDIMGDGLMVFWGGNKAFKDERMIRTKAITSAGLCGRDMLKVRESVINRIISDENLGPSINIGIGVTFDSVIVTKIGIPGSYDVKAFGSCINIASKYASNTWNKVKVLKKVKNEWPTGKNGTIRFIADKGGDGYILESSK